MWEEGRYVEAPKTAAKAKATTPTASKSTTPSARRAGAVKDGGEAAAADEGRRLSNVFSKVAASPGARTSPRAPPKPPASAKKNGDNKQSPAVRRCRLTSG